MLNLKNVDLIIIDSINVPQAIETLKICMSEINFGNVYLFTHLNIIDDSFKTILINEIQSIEAYSDFCLRLDNYLENDYVLLVQNDGFIVNPKLWSNDFLNYDYIGAPWNLTFVPGQRVGNGGFSLRSKKFLKFSNTFESTDNIPEDNFLCLYKYEDALKFGIKFAPLKIASKFAHEFHNPCAIDYEPEKHFGFHGKDNVESARNFILKSNLMSM